jgi:hypothetical protein
LANSQACFASSIFLPSTELQKLQLLAPHGDGGLRGVEPLGRAVELFARYGISLKQFRLPVIVLLRELELGVGNDEAAFRRLNFLLAWSRLEEVEPRLKLFVTGLGLGNLFRA